MKKIFIPIVSIIILGLIIISVNYSFTYNIGNNMKDIEINLKKYINKTLPNLPKQYDYHIVYTSDIDNKKYVLSLLNDKLIFSELKRGINNKFKINSVTWGFDSFRSEIIEINKKKYFIVFGENYKMQMNYVITSINGHEYRANIPPKQYFISYCSVPSSTQLGVQDPDCKIFDKDNRNVTNDIILNNLKK